MRRLRVPCLVLALAATAGAALAHGGSYSPPAPAPGPSLGPGPSGGPSSGPQVPPGTADPPAPVTRWESWWAANKEYFLRLGEEMRAVDGPLTQGGGGKRALDQAVEAREARDIATREALVPIFVEALGDESFEVRTAAAIALGKSGSPLGSAPLRRAAETDRHKDVRESAILGLGLLGASGEIPYLDGRLNDPKEAARARSFAAFALGLIGGEDAATSLLSFADGRPEKPSTFHNERPDLVASTYVAMGLTGDEHVVPVLRAAAAAGGRSDDTVRAFAVLSLGRMGDRESLGPLGRALLTEKDAGVRRSAAIALGRIANSSDKATVDALLAAARDDGDEVTRQFAAVSLGGIADEAIVFALEKLFASASPASRPFCALALALAHAQDSAPALRTALTKETDESIKASYCVALGLLGDKEAAPLLMKELDDRGRIWLQGYAALSLGMMRHIESADVLFARLEREPDARLRANLAVALGLLHDPRARTHLVATLERRDGSVYERGGAAMGLGVLRINEAVPAIVSVYHDKKEQDLVRAFAVVSLGLIADPASVPKLSRFAIDNNYSLSTDPLNEVLSIL